LRYIVTVASPVVPFLRIEIACYLEKQVYFLELVVESQRHNSDRVVRS